MKHDHNAFENQIFNHYRNNKKKIEEAIKFLQEQGYTIYEENKYLTYLNENYFYEIGFEKKKVN